MVRYRSIAWGVGGSTVSVEAAAEDLMCRRTRASSLSNGVRSGLCSDTRRRPCGAGCGKPLVAVTDGTLCVRSLASQVLVNDFPGGPISALSQACR